MKTNPNSIHEDVGSIHGPSQWVKNLTSGIPIVSHWVKNLTSNHEDVCSIPSLAQRVKYLAAASSCGLGH